MVSHAALLVAVQPQPSGAVTVIVPDVLDAETDRDVGETLMAQAAPCCVTSSVCPAAVSVAVRARLEGFAPTENVIVPVPLPLDPLVTDSQPLLLDAVHVQPAGAESVTELMAPDAGSVALPADRL